MRYTKTISNIAISTALGCSCASCSDFLNLTPYNEIIVESSYQNGEGFRQTVSRAYEPLRSMYNTEEWSLGEAKSDNATYIIYVAKSFLDGEGPDQLPKTPINDNAGMRYNNCYVIIGRCSWTISEIDQVDFDAEVKNNLKGQASFFWALCHFNLVQYFGGVPLYTTPSTAYEETFEPRASVDEVYERIMKDAQEANDLLSVGSRQEIGRVPEGSI